jgi:hypothetical protein
MRLQAMVIVFAPQLLQIDGLEINEHALADPPGEEGDREQNQINAHANRETR